MASSVSVAVDDDPIVAISTATGTRRNVAVYNSGASTVYLGGAAVTSTDGYPLTAGDDVTMNLGEAETLYAVCATSGSATLKVLVS